MRAHREAKTVFALGGGGNLGAVQVGMLQALLEAGVAPDAVVGTSVGALNGAFLAGHCDLAGMEQLADLWRSVRRKDVFPIDLRSLTRGVVGHQQYLFESLGLGSLIVRTRLGFERIEESPIPLRIVTTDVDSGDAIVLTTGDVVRGLLASSAIPGVFPPVKTGGRTLIDGGVVANTPIAQAEMLDPEVIYVLPTVSEHLASKLSGNAIVMLQRGVELAARPSERRAMDEARVRRDVRVLPVPESARSLSIFDFGATHRLIDEAYVLASSWLDDVGKQANQSASCDAPFQIDMRQRRTYGGAVA